MLNNGHVLDGKYEVIRILGQGGMGTVYLCKNNRIDNLWAIKEILVKKDDKINFLAEPNILKHLEHEGIPRIVDIFYEEDNLYMVEDYIEGETLKEHIEKNGPAAEEKLIDITLQLCSILEYLHSFNPSIIYRDLKPANIMVKANGKIVLIDFGIARTYKEGQEGDTVLLGSRGYIAPEQLVNIQSNEQTDIYSLGATMYFMITGKAPSLPTELLFKDNYPESLNTMLLEIIQKSVEIEPQNRYKNVQELKIALLGYINSRKYNKTTIMGGAKDTILMPKSDSMEEKPQKKKSKYIAVGIVVFGLVLFLCLYLILGNKKQEAKLPPANTENKTEVKKDTPESKATVENKVEDKDTIVRGILYKDKPIILNSNASTGKSKDKGKDKYKESDKNLQLQYNLNPSASINNSKYNISINSIQIIDDNVIANLNIENKTDDIINIDLTKTYLLNGKNEAVKSYNPSSIDTLPIPQHSKKQDIKLYFKDFDFEGSSCTVKTILNDGSKKDLNLSIDIK